MNYYVKQAARRGLLCMALASIGHVGMDGLDPLPGHPSLTSWPFWSRTLALAWTMWVGMELLTLIKVTVDDEKD